MTRRAFPWLSVAAVIALLVVSAPAPAARAEISAPEVDGIIHSGTTDLDFYIEPYAYMYPRPTDPGWCQDSEGNLIPAVTLYKRVFGDYLYVAAVGSRCLNDNVFGHKRDDQGNPGPDEDYLVSAHWEIQPPNYSYVGHTFFDLYDSDCMCFELQCANDNTNYTWCQDYIYNAADGAVITASWQSDFNGPDTELDTPDNPPPNIESSSSLVWNMTQVPGWDVTLDGAREGPAQWKSPASGAGDGEVSHIDVTAFGSGYTTATVEISGGDGSGATAIAEIIGGQIRAVHVTNKGSGYNTTAPDVEIKGDATGATAVAVLGPKTAAEDPRVTDEEGYPPDFSEPITHDFTNKWEWPIVYEWRIPLNEYCPAVQFDRLAILSAHNSPTKGGDDPVPTAVELVSFAAEAGKRSVTLKWETATETDNLGFNLYRAEAVRGKRTKINDQLIPTDLAPGSGFGASYAYTDMPLAAGRTYYYWLEDVDIYGNAELHGPVDATLVNHPGLDELFRKVAPIILPGN